MDVKVYLRSLQCQHLVTVRGKLSTMGDSQHANLF